MFLKARNEELAQPLNPYMTHASSITLMINILLGLLLAGGRGLGLGAGFRSG